VWPAQRVWGAVALAAFAPLVVSQFGWVSPTNFRGFDEWLMLSLLSRGIVTFPYANRPLALVWAFPAHAVSQDAPVGFLLVHAVYLGATAVLTFLTIKRLWPAEGLLAWLAGALTLVWAPTDATRLCSVQMIIYSGSAFGCALAMWLFAGSFVRRSRRWLLLAVCVGAVVILSGEAALGALAVAPLLIFSSEAAKDDRRRAVWWSLPWVGLLALGTVRAVWPLWFENPEATYQVQMSLARAGRPGFLARLGIQYREHLWPLVSALPRLGHPAMGLGLVTFGMGFVSAARAHPRGQPSIRRSVVLTGLGLVWAGLAYAPYVASPTVVRAVRTQFLSAPGIALCLAAAVMLVAGATRRGLLVAATLGAFVVAQGTDRTLALQRRWDRGSFYTVQRTALRQMADTAPDLERGTLVILLGARDIFRLDAGFRHAVKYLYDGKAVGHSPESRPFLYDTRFEAQGVTSEPLAIIRGPWNEPVVLHPYDRLVVFQADDAGQVALMAEWPATLPPLPPGARYAPWSRIDRNRPRRLPGWLR
jgi:hypothetical protein